MLPDGVTSAATMGQLGAAVPGTRARTHLPPRPSLWGDRTRKGRAESHRNPAASGSGNRRVPPTVAAAPAPYQQGSGPPQPCPQRCSLFPDCSRSYYSPADARAVGLTSVLIGLEQASVDCPSVCLLRENF